MAGDEESRASAELTAAELVHEQILLDVERLRARAVVLEREAMLLRTECVRLEALMRYGREYEA